MKVIAVIPARYESTRLPGKPLLRIGEKTILQMVYERAVQCPLLDEVLVATDDERILEAVTDFGGKGVMTARTHATGTDRIAEAVATMAADVVINVQGDEPLITPEVIGSIIEPFESDADVQMSTLKTPIRDHRDLFNPNVVKVITDSKGNAIYFSRSPIPFRKSPGMALFFDVPEDQLQCYYRHVGLYGYRKSFLMAYVDMPCGMLERMEGLEQLRAVEHGVTIRVVESEYDGWGVDTVEDYLQLKKKLGDNT